jgi:hypothetical protein
MSCTGFEVVGVGGLPRELSGRRLWCYARAQAMATSNSLMVGSWPCAR